MSKRLERLYKSTEDRVVTGVAAGLADFFDTNPNVFRALFILFTLANGLGLVFYIMLSIVLPNQEEVVQEEDLVFFENIVKGNKPPKQDPKPKDGFWDELIVRENFFAFIIILIGSAVLHMDVVPWSLIPPEAQIPVLIIVIGLAFVIKSTNASKHTINKQ